MVLMKSRHPGVRRRPKKPGSTEAGNPVRVLLADSEQGFRRYLRRILERQPDLNVVGEAADGEEVGRLAQQLKPEVVLIDIDSRRPGESKPHCPPRRSSCSRFLRGKPTAKLQRS